MTGAAVVVVDRARLNTNRPISIDHHHHHHNHDDDDRRGRDGNAPPPFFSLNSADGHAKWKLASRDGQYKVEEAAVPGTVHLDLIKAGILKGQCGVVWRGGLVWCWVGVWGPFDGLMGSLGDRRW